MGTTYWDYIRVEDLLRLQNGLARDDRDLSNDEVLFITVHQVFELWFKVVLREVGSLRDLFVRVPVPETALAAAAASLDRVTRIFRCASEHWNVVESLGTRDYLDFREKLLHASGFQSAQMREIEVLMGLDDAERVGFAKDRRYLDALRALDGSPSPALARVEARRLDRPTLREAIESWLHRTPIRGSKPGDAGDEAVVDAFVEEYLASLGAETDAVVQGFRRDGAPGGIPMSSIESRYRTEMDDARAFLAPGDPRRRRVRAAILFIEGYRELPLLAWPHAVLSKVVEMEQGILNFRQRHARMVERVIGRRLGTGGSGLDYLDETARYRVFKDLWSARTLLVRRAALPPVGDTTPYEFRAGTP